MQTVLFHETVDGWEYRWVSTCSRWTVSCVHSIACIANAVIMHKEWGRVDCLRPIG